MNVVDIDNRRETLSHVLCLGFGFTRPSTNIWICESNGMFSDREYEFALNEGTSELEMSEKSLMGKSTTVITLDQHARELFQSIRDFLVRSGFQLPTEVETKLF